MKNTFYILLSIFSSISGMSQVIFEENFNNYPPGHLINDYESTTPDQGGWFVGKIRDSSHIIVTPETGKGNVIVFQYSPTQLNNSGTILKQAYGNISLLWNNRNSQNNVMKFEYEYYTTGNNNGSILIHNNFSKEVIATHFSIGTDIIRGFYNNGSGSLVSVILRNVKNSPYLNTWIKVEMFLDFDNLYAYFHIPLLNITTKHSFINDNSNIPDNILLTYLPVDKNSVIKYDNLKLSALNSIPTYIFLETDNFISSLFNVYPNPSSDIINISNDKNIHIEQIDIFDTTGKKIDTKTFNINDISAINIKNLSTGNYYLHIKTKDGMGIKNFTKK